jgi:predicted flap endonuclease-1-like 5' DNA nuclease
MMFNGAHVLETALLMLAAFLIGAILGTLARLGLRRPKTETVAVVAAVSDAPAAAPMPESPTLVTPPVIDPLPRSAPQLAPLELPTLDFSEAIVAAAKPQSLAMNGMAPARVAGQATSGKRVAAPRHEPAAALPSDGGGAEVIQFPARAAEPELAVDVAEPAVAAELPVEEPVVLDAEAVAVAPAVEPNEPEPAVAETVEAEVETEADEPTPAVEPVEVPAVSLAPEAEHEETAAMRAIEGNWSPRRRRTASPAAASEDIAVEPEPPPERPGRPQGLDAPRPEGPDNLTNIIGVLPILETALNRIGVYHFDQVAALTEENIGWVEGHLGIEGRIGREHWREQARELALVTAKAAKAAGK